MAENGPELTWPKACIKCGHCVAICPYAALDHTRNPLASQVEISQFPLMAAETAERFLRTRRSIRTYKPDKTAPETLLRLLNIARFAPTGGNSQGISYLVISDADLMKQVSVKIIDWLEEQIRHEVAWVKPYAGMAKIYRETGYDVVLRGAPHLVLALAAAQNPIGRDNGRFALTYVELYAPSLGLGSCWAGFFEMAAAAGYEPLLGLLDIPEGKVIVGAIMLGVPKYRYQRLVERNPLDVILR
jgi:nitroreductase